MTTQTDVIGGVQLTAAAALVVAALSAGMASDMARRVKIAAVLSAWFAIVVVLAATRALYYEHGTGSPGVGAAVVIPVVLMCVALARVPSLRERIETVPLWLLAGVNVVRILGAEFIVLYAQ